MSKITNDERRKVAARLRMLTKNPYGLARFLVEEFLGLVHDENYFVGSFYTSESVSHLADLIEPAHEQTCTMEFNEGYSDDEFYPTSAYTCSECGWMTLEGKPNYCPNCGAKVVGE